MATTKKVSRVFSMLLALVMIFTIVPFQSFAANDVPAADIVLKDGATVAISSDMSDDQINKAMFEAVVEDSKGASYNGYTWEVYGWTQSEYGPAFQREKWVSFTEGAYWEEKILLSTHHFTIRPVKDSGDAAYKVRLAGGQQEVTINKISKASVNYNYDTLKGTVLVNDQKVPESVTGLNPSKEISFKVVPAEGYTVESVKVNNKVLNERNGVYTYTPFANTNVEVTFKEDGTFFDVNINAGAGVDVKVNGTSVKDSVRVKADTNYKFEFIPNGSTSVKAVKLDGSDITKNVEFKNFVGTMTASFKGQSTVTVDTIGKNDAIVLGDNRTASTAIFANGNWDWNAIRNNIINAVIDKQASANVEFTPENIEIQHYTKYFTAGNVPGISSDWVSIEGQDWGPLPASWYYAISIGNNHVRIRFKGNEQFRPTDFVEFDLNLVDVAKAQLAVKENPTVELVETDLGKFDFNGFEEKIFNAAIDASASNPSNVKFSDVEVSVSHNITESGKYPVTIKFLGTTSYYESSVTFDVTVNVKNLDSANLVIKNNDVEVFIKETSVGVYDNSKLAEDVLTKAVDLAASVDNGLNRDLITLEIQDNITTEGKYTAKVSYPDTEKLHGVSYVINVNVKVLRLPTVSVKAPEGASAVLYKNFDGSYDYKRLEKDVFELLAVSNVKGLTAENFKFEYKLLNGLGVDDGILSGNYYPFDQGWIGADAGGTYRYLYKGGTFTIRVSIPNGNDYYGTSAVFTLNVSIGDDHTAEFVLNDGQPYNVVLNMTKDGGYNYEELKETIFNAAIKGVKNVPGEVKWNNVNYQYSVGLTGAFNNFDVWFVDGDLTNMYHYLRNGGVFTIRISLPEGSNYHGNHVDFNVNVTVVDPFQSKVALKDVINPVELKETTVGSYDLEALKKAIFESCIDLTKSVPSTLSYSDFEIVVPEIKGSGDYTVTIKFNGNFDYNGSSASTSIRINVVDLPTAKINVKNPAISVVINETRTGIYDVQKVVDAVLTDALDLAGSTPALKAEDVKVTFNSTINKTGKYTATVKYAGTNKIHGTEVTINVDVTVNALPKVQINALNKDLTLYKDIKGDYDYDKLKQDIFNECLKVTGVDNLTYNKFNYEYKLLNGLGIDDGILSGNYYQFEQGWIDADAGGTYRYLYKGGTFTIKVSIPDSSSYYGSEAVFTINLKTADPYYEPIVVKENHEVDFTLNYDVNGQYDYERLRKEIFDAVIDTEKSPARVTYENSKVTYQIVDAMDSHTGIGAGDYYEFEQGWLGADAAGTYKYLYKGGTFNFKISVPAIEGSRYAEVVVRLNVTPAQRATTNVVLKDGTVQYSANLDDIKTAIFNLIDFEASNLPEGVTKDSFRFEYQTKNYTAGDVLGVETWWVPLEGMKHPTLLGSYFKPIGVGTQKIRVIYNGDEMNKEAYSKSATLVVEPADLSISLNRDYKFIDETLKKDLVTTSLEGDFEHYYIMVDAQQPTATIYIDSTLGLSMTDFTANIPFNDVLLKIFGIDAILSADEIYQRRGLTRDQMVTLLSDSRFIDYMKSYYSVDANACAEMLNMLNRLPESVNHFMFQMGQPSKAGTYFFMAITAKQNYKTAVATNDTFYVKFHSKGVKLQWMQNTSELSVFSAKNFDFSAVVTKNGIIMDSDHVRYTYVGFSLSRGIYLSTKNPPREAGFYIQTAYTGFGGRFAFPKIRTFLIAL